MSDKQSFIQRFLKYRDRNAIVICIVIAVSFWLTDALSHNYTHDYNFTLDYELEGNVSFASAPHSTVKARLSGQGWELLKASIRRNFKRVPVPVLRPEITRSDLIAAVYQHLSDYEIVVREVDVDVLTLDINMVVTHSFPVQLDIVAVCAEGYVFKDSLHCTPASVSVTGPSSVVDRIRTILIEKPELGMLSGDLDRTVDLVLPDEVYIEVEPKQVHLLAEVEKEVQFTTMLPLEFKGDTAGLDISPVVISFTCSVGESRTEAPDLQSISAVCRVTPDDTTGTQIELNNIPAFARNIKIFPDSVTIVMREKD